MIVSRSNAGRTPLAALVLAGIALASPGIAAAQDGPPEPLPFDDIPFPAFEERLLSNGADLIVVPHDEQPYVTVNLVVRAGNAADPRNRAGVAAMVASLLNKGTDTRTALEVADATDHIGASLSAAAGDDWTNVVLGVVTSQLDAGLELLGDIVVNPSFPDEEIDQYRQQTVTGLQVQLGSPGFLASREFQQAVYGRHPYGLLPTPESIERIRRSDLIAYHLRHYKPTNSLVVVAGDVTVDDIEARLNRALADWEPGPSRPPTYFDIPAREEKEIILVHRPESVQSTILVGQSAMKGDHEDWMPLNLGSRVLGGSSTGRLFQVLREDRGLDLRIVHVRRAQAGPGVFPGERRGAQRGHRQRPRGAAQSGRHHPRRAGARRRTVGRAGLSHRVVPADHRDAPGDRQPGRDLSPAGPLHGGAGVVPRPGRRGGARGHPGRAGGALRPRAGRGRGRRRRHRDPLEPHPLRSRAHG